MLSVHPLRAGLISQLNLWVGVSRGCAGLSLPVALRRQVSTAFQAVRTLNKSLTVRKHPFGTIGS